MHNTESGESFWKFPEDVLKGVVEFDRREREKQEKRERGEPSDLEDELDESAEVVATPAVKVVPLRAQEEDDDEYEEVTDSEGEGEPSKRRRDASPTPDDGPVEFNEDDIAWQLQAMEEDAYINEEDQEAWDDEEPPLSHEDSVALFQDLLTDYAISPFSTWETIITEGRIISDDRYLSLPTTKARREVFDTWARAQIQTLKEKREKEAKQDPRIPYFQLLDEHASAKLYWPEFRRKFRKEAAMRETKVSEKEREKWYREYVKRLGLPIGTLKSDFTALLKSMPLNILNRGTRVETLPTQLRTDLRFISLPVKEREGMLEAWVSGLGDAPGDGGDDGDVEGESAGKRERERREKALRDREERVQEGKRLQARELRFGKERLNLKEEELQNAMRVGKGGLRSQLEDAEMGEAE